MRTAAALPTVLGLLLALALRGPRQAQLLAGSGEIGRLGDWTALRARLDGEFLRQDRGPANDDLASAQEGDLAR